LKLIVPLALNKILQDIAVHRSVNYDSSGVESFVNLSQLLIIMLCEISFQTVQDL